MSSTAAARTQSLTPASNSARVPWPRRYFFNRTSSQADSEARVPQSGVVSIRGQPGACTSTTGAPSRQLSAELPPSAGLLPSADPQDPGGGVLQQSLGAPQQGPEA